MRTSPAIMRFELPRVGRASSVQSRAQASIHRLDNQNSRSGRPAKPRLKSFRLTAGRVAAGRHSGPDILIDASSSYKGYRSSVTLIDL